MASGQSSPTSAQGGLPPKEQKCRTNPINSLIFNKSSEKTNPTGRVAGLSREIAAIAAGRLQATGAEGENTSMLAARLVRLALSFLV
ncbi:MAG TPA: hypothetical protein VH744_11410, partial [Terriglobales bacterium]